MAPNMLKAKSIGVRLHGKEETTRWENLAALESSPSRYPWWGAINGLGIEASWNILVEAGNLTHLFSRKFSSYKALTVEFLTTLHVEYSDRRVESVSFRLLNQEHELTLSQFNDVFKLMGEDEEGYTEEPEDYNKNEFWNLITLAKSEDGSSSSGSTFNPSRAKINAVRNPVLRYMLKSLVYLPLAHTEAGSMQSEMLFILWGMLARRRINMGHYMIRHLERQSRKKNGKLCCGGVISAIAFHFGISFEGRIADHGSTMIDWDTLKMTKMIMLDKRRVGYFLQDNKKHFKFPDPQLTAVGGWTYQENWRMDTPAHEHGFLTDPPQGTAAPDAEPRYVNMAYIPRPQIPDEPLQIQAAAAEMEEDNEQPTNEPEGGESSRPKRRRPQGRTSMDAYLTEMTAGMRSMQLSLQQSREQHELFMARQDSNWEQYHIQQRENRQWQVQQDARWVQQDTQWDQQQQWHHEELQWRAQQDTRWEEQLAFMNAYYARYPPPPSD